MTPELKHALEQLRRDVQNRDARCDALSLAVRNDEADAVPALQRARDWAEAEVLASTRAVLRFYDEQREAA